MKTIYKTIYGGWSETKPASKEEIDKTARVADDFQVGFMNSSFYTADDYDAAEYAAAKNREARRIATDYLNQTDYITVQWSDETALGIEHTRSEEEYREILLKREQARETIRNIA